MIENVQVIGSGGAFDDETNSSFLINLSGTSVLYDCGYNVFSELKRLEKDDENIIIKINHIIISHMDDDHMGSLKSLLYYRYFMFGLTTEVYIDDEEYIKDINYEIKGSQKVPANIVNSQRFKTFSIMYNNFTFIEGNHHIPTKGLIVYNNKQIVLISGDTKAKPEIEKKYWKIYNEIDAKNVCTKSLIFHDFSFWNAPSRQVHACKGDVEVEYTIEFLEKAIMYHNNQSNLKGNVYTLKTNELIGNETTLKEVI